ncbi:refilin-B isoform X2 [Tursiops truncatus]|uniref:refilin-B isoform X2 n=1 Tax=Tursiops truncatus TaxID=9739 RepID=UPI003CCF0EE4
MCPSSWTRRRRATASWTVRTRGCPLARAPATGRSRRPGAAVAGSGRRPPGRWSPTRRPPPRPRIQLLFPTPWARAARQGYAPCRSVKEWSLIPYHQLKYTSSVKYDSERHFIDDVHLPLGLAVASCSQTITCIPSCTWRNYKAEVRFEPRHKPARFLSTTIVYPKYPKTVYTTTLDYNCRKTLRRFLSSVELEAIELVGGDYLSEES